MKADWLPLSEAAATTRPYTSARSLLKGEGWVFLDANECPFTCPLDDLAIAGLNRYPDPTADHLRRNLARHYLVSSESVLVTHGSDELIDLCVRTFVRRTRSVLAPAPTYGMYAVAASSHGLAYRSVPLNPQLNLNMGALAREFEGADLLFLCTPNNPTGTTLSCEDVAGITRAFQGVVVVDEAYGEFADEEGIRSAIELVREESRNLIVMRTFSKAFAAAGLRLGYALASPRLISSLVKMKPPYNVSAPAQAIGLKLWRRRQQMVSNVRRLIAERHRVAQRCEELGCGVHSSAANFFLTQLPCGYSAGRVYARLRDEFQIVVRHFDGISRLQDMLRISIGTPEENDRLLSALQRLLS